MAIDTQPLPNAGNVNDQIPRMVTDPRTGRLYVAWQQVTGRFKMEDVLVASSADRGQTFSNPVKVNLPSYDAGPQIPRVGPGGRLYVVFATFPIAALSSQTQQPELVHVVSSSDHGATFSPPVTAQREYQCGPTFHGPNTCSSATSKYDGAENNGPELVAGPSGRDAYLVSYGLVSNIFRVQFSVSHDAGKTWGVPRTIGIPPRLAGDNQVLPTIAIAPNGRLDIVYYDLAVPSLFENTYLISSSDQGATFSPPQLLSSARSNTSLESTFGNGPFDGSQLVVATNAFTYAAWTDNRRAVNPNDEDIFFAAVGPPALGRLRVSPSAFRAASSGRSIAARNRRGTRVSYRDTLAALTTFKVQHSVHGFRVGRRCTSRRPRHARRVRRCGLVRTSGSFTHRDVAGSNAFHFTGRPSGHKLPPGTYRLCATPVLAGRVGNEVAIRFTING